LLADLFIGAGIGHKFLPGRISHCVINFMRREITNSVSYKYDKRQNSILQINHTATLRALIIYSFIPPN